MARHHWIHECTKTRYHNRRWPVSNWWHSLKIKAAASATLNNFFSGAKNTPKYFLEGIVTLYSSTTHWENQWRKHFTGRHLWGSCWSILHL
jgi:hypothetical protein